MTKPLDTTLLVLTEAPVEVPVASALQSAARALGYEEGCSIFNLSEIPDCKRFVFEADPWAVIAIDEASIAMIGRDFSLPPEEFCPDKPASVAGYILVAVPGFAACLDDPDAKRIAWKRMRSAAHPKNPLD